MTHLLRRRFDLVRRDPSGRDLLVGVGVAVLVVGVAGAALGKTGVLLAGLVVGTLAAVVAVVVPPVALLLVIVATFTRMAQTQLLPDEVVVPAFAVMLVSFAVVLARRLVARPRVGLPRVGAVGWLMVAYLGWNLLSVALPHEYAAEVPVNGEPFEFRRWFLSAIVLPFAVYQVARVVLVGERAVRWLLWTVVGVTAVSTWLSVAQFHAPALTWPAYIVDAPNWPGRANGIFNQPVINGLVLVIGIVVCLFLASRPGLERAPRIGLYVLVAVATYAVYLTHTRAAVLGLAFTVVVGALLARGWRRGFLAIGVLGVVGLASQGATKLLSPKRSEGGFGSPSEAYDRLNAAATAFRAISGHPVAGIGVGRFGMYNTYEHVAWSDTVDWSRGQVIIAHENDLGIGAEVGLPGLGLWLAIIVVLAVLLWRARRDLPGDGVTGGALGLVALVALGVMMVNGFTVDLRPLDFATVLPFAIVGAAVGSLERHREAPGGEADGTGVDEPGTAGAGTSGAEETGGEETGDRDDGTHDGADTPADVTAARTNGHHVARAR